MVSSPARNTPRQRRKRKGEAIEVFIHPGRQVIVAETSLSGGNYFWPDGQGPEALIAPPAEWWQYVLDKARDYPKPAAGAHRTVSTGRGDWKRLTHCPICGRNENTVCQVHTDGETIRCFRGNSFFPLTSNPESAQGSGDTSVISTSAGAPSPSPANLGSPLQRLRRQHRD